MTLKRKSILTPRFYLKNSNTEFSDVYCHIQLNKIPIKVYLKSPIETALWDKGNSLAKTKNRYRTKDDKALFESIQMNNNYWESNCKALNRKIAKIENIVCTYCNETPFNEYDLSLLKAKINLEIHGIKETSQKPLETENTDIYVVAYIEDLLQRMKSGEHTKPDYSNYSKDAIDNYNALCTVMKLYEKNYDVKLSFDDIDFKFSKSLQKFMFDCEDLNINKLTTTARYFKDLKAVMNTASKEKVSSNYIDFKHIRVKSMKTTRVALCKKEIKEIRKLNLTGDMKLYRDLFLISYYTGFRISDLTTIKPYHIENKKITKVLQKGFKPYTFKLKKKARILLGSYNNQVPKFKIQDFRKQLKVIAKMAGITKIIEYPDNWKGKEIISKKPKWKMVCPHTARRSAIKQKELDGWTELRIMEFSAHSKSETLKSYLDVVF